MAVTMTVKSPPTTTPPAGFIRERETEKVKERHHAVDDGRHRSEHRFRVIHHQDRERMQLQLEFAKSRAGRLSHPTHPLGEAFRQRTLGRSRAESPLAEGGCEANNVGLTAAQRQHFAPSPTDENRWTTHAVRHRRALQTLDLVVAADEIRSTG